MREIIETVNAIRKPSRRAALPKCGRCGAIFGLYQFTSDCWRCPECVWKEREKLIELCKQVVEMLPAYVSAGLHHDPPGKPNGRRLLRHIRRALSDAARGDKR